MNVKVTKEMLEKDFDELTVEEEETLQSVLFDMFKFDIDYALYNNHIDLPIIDENGLTVEIEKIYDYQDKDVRLSYDFNTEYGVLLSLCTDLDYAYYNSDIELWNAICTNNDLINHDNIVDVYSESIFFLFSDIEQQIYETSDLLTNDDIWEFINYYEYIELIDTDELYCYISLAINELNKWIDKALEMWWENDLDELYFESEFENKRHLYEQLDENGIMEYIL